MSKAASINDELPHEFHNFYNNDRLRSVTIWLNERSYERFKAIGNVFWSALKCQYYLDTVLSTSMSLMDFTTALENSERAYRTPCVLVVMPQRVADHFTADSTGIACIAPHDPPFVMVALPISEIIRHHIDLGPPGSTTYDYFRENKCWNTKSVRALLSDRNRMIVLMPYRCVPINSNMFATGNDYLDTALPRDDLKSVAAEMSGMWTVLNRMHAKQHSLTVTSTDGISRQAAATQRTVQEVTREHQIIRYHPFETRLVHDRLLTHLFCFECLQPWYSFVDTLYDQDDPEEIIRKPGKLLFCSNCREAFYCSPECQKKHWSTVHKFFCKGLCADRTQLVALLTRSKKQKSPIIDENQVECIITPMALSMEDVQGIFVSVPDAIEAAAVAPKEEEKVESLPPAAVVAPVTSGSSSSTTMQPSSAEVVSLLESVHFRYYGENGSEEPAQPVPPQLVGAVQQLFSSGGTTTPTPAASTAATAAADVKTVSKCDCCVHQSEISDEEFQGFVKNYEQQFGMSFTEEVKQSLVANFSNDDDETIKHKNEKLVDLTKQLFHHQKQFCQTHASAEEAHEIDEMVKEFESKFGINFSAIVNDETMPRVFDNEETRHKKNKRLFELVQENVQRQQQQQQQQFQEIESVQTALFPQARVVFPADAVKIDPVEKLVRGEKLLSEFLNAISLPSQNSPHSQPSGTINFDKAVDSLRALIDMGVHSFCIGNDVEIELQAGNKDARFLLHEIMRGFMSSPKIEGSFGMPVSLKIEQDEQPKNAAAGSSDDVSSISGRKFLDFIYEHMANETQRTGLKKTEAEFGSSSLCTLVDIVFGSIDFSEYNKDLYKRTLLSLTPQQFDRLYRFQLIERAILVVTFMRFRKYLDEFTALFGERKISIKSMQEIGESMVENLLLEDGDSKICQMHSFIEGMERGLCEFKSGGKFEFADLIQQLEQSITVESITVSSRVAGDGASSSSTSSGASPSSSSVTEFRKISTQRDPVHDRIDKIKEFIFKVMVRLCAELGQTLAFCVLPVLEELQQGVIASLDAHNYQSADAAYLTYTGALMAGEYTLVDSKNPMHRNLKLMRLPEKFVKDINRLMAQTHPNDDYLQKCGFTTTDALNAYLHCREYFMLRVDDEVTKRVYDTLFSSTISYVQWLFPDTSMPLIWELQNVLGTVDYKELQKKKGIDARMHAIFRRLAACKWCNWYNTACRVNQRPIRTCSEVNECVNQIWKSIAIQEATKQRYEKQQAEKKKQSQPLPSIEEQLAFIGSDKKKKKQQQQSSKKKQHNKGG